ncbi:hypothetical protein [Cellulomonas sp. ATA003]|uniref:hypothetical protein n=1 Tax=Cellulomonas sp. ATA003 TaxID=3073064 RepID=UPI0028733359|nr:hypothetical protein [Cellulomonas sp. ATA003]WNB86075.1 hypothetical protein REH70_01950 [Cellulomonas sp. ATA003]
MPRPTARLAVVLASAALLLAGCTSSDDEQDTADSAAPTASAEEAQAADETTEAMREGAGEDAQEQPVTATLPVLGSRETTAGSTPLRVDLNEVAVSGEVMTVLFTVHNLAEDTDNWQVGQFFDDGTSTAPLDADGERGEETSTLRAFTTDGVTVVDAVNGMAHRAAYDTAGACACSGGLSNTFVGAGTALVLSTSFAAPPEDVDTVTVQIPGAGSFDGVALTR